MVKYAAITGAGTGIGYQMSLALHERGYKIIGISPDFDLHNMMPLKDEIGLIPIVCDITDVKAIQIAAEKVHRICGGNLALLYNNAGISPTGGPMIYAEDDMVRKLFDVNVLGHMFVTKYFSQMVINAKGTIVFTASVAARVPLSWAGFYCATKSAIDQYAMCLRTEMEPFDVKVYSVITGGVNTAIADHNRRGKLEGPFACDEVLESMVASSMMSRNPKTSWSAERYANKVADQICKKRTQGFNLYSGSYAYLLHVARWYLPHWLMEFLVMRHFKQRRANAAVRKNWQAQKKEL